MSNIDTDYEVTHNYIDRILENHSVPAGKLDCGVIADYRLPEVSLDIFISVVRPLLDEIIRLNGEIYKLSQEIPSKGTPPVP